MKIRCVWLHLCGAKPKIPKQIFRFFTFIGRGHRETLRPHGTIRPDLYLRDLTKLSGIYPPLNHAMQWIRPTLVSHLSHHFFIPGHFGEHACLSDVVRHWFLYIYVFSAL